MTHSTKEQDLAAKARFDADTAEHQMTVLHDDGLYRHLRFAKPGTGFYWFEVVTWPGTLTLSGDHGCWTFRRVEDMFEFFRDSRGVTRINPGYWAEKLVVGHSGGYKAAQQYDGEHYVAEVNKEITEFLEDGRGAAWPDDVKKALRDLVDEEVLMDSYGNEPPANDTLAHTALAEFRFNHVDEDSNTYQFEFHDTWEWNLEQLTVHYLWSCWAIVHAIAAYDAHKAEEAAA